MDNLNLFNNLSTNPVVPGELKIDDCSGLMSQDISQALLGEVVKTLIVPETMEIELPNYVIDFTNIDDLNVFQKESIKSLLSEKGTVAIYIHKKENMAKVGYGSKEKLDYMISTFRTHVLGEDAKVYENVEKGKELIEVKMKDVTRLMMNI